MEVQENAGIIYTCDACVITTWRLGLWAPLVARNWFLTLFIVNVVVNFLSQVIFVFLLFLGMVMYVNEVETKEK